MHRIKKRLKGQTMGAVEMSKKLKKEILSLASMAYEEELRNSLGPLAKKFEQWKAGEFTSINLVEAIHEFHNGDAREIFKKYDSPIESLLVARAIVNGVFKEHAISPDVLKALEKELEFYKGKI